ncbi:hypothetical protein BDA96_02G375900 [Sorghum bicolor]|uniref:Uncharacterized protein n=1 Tax=Sorghum bicolor TaxID=4558 RepID=A0A921UV00_SORBI|nr:hypothetical protein BDA96_02G375900 [Sorghum bicolor]
MESDASTSPRRRSTSCYSDSGDSSCSEPFSECGSDDLSFTPAAAAGIHRLLLSCAAEASEDAISSLVAELECPSPSLDSLRRAAMELRLLAKHNPDNRVRRAGERRLRAAPAVPARRRLRGRHRPRGRGPAAGLPPRDRGRAREEGRRHGAVRALQRRAREPAARRGGRRRAAAAGPHGRPGVRHGGQGRVRPPLPGELRRGPCRRRRGRRHPRPGRDGGGRHLAAEGDRHPFPPADLRGQHRVPDHGRPRGRHPSPRRPLPILIRSPQAQNKGGVVDRDAAAAAEPEPPRATSGGRCGRVTEPLPFPALGGACSILLFFGETSRRRSAGQPACACK